MTTLEKMKILTDSAQYDLCDYVSHNKSSQVNMPGIYEATGHNGWGHRGRLAYDHTARYPALDSLLSKSRQMSS